MKFNFEDIPIEPFWNTGKEKELKMHRIHSYPAKFPSFITTKAIEYASKCDCQVNAVADVFCGCGTTAFEAKRNNVDFWGCDINPVATLIATVKSRKYQPWCLEKYFNKIIHCFDAGPVPDEFSNANERLKYWYSEKQYNELFLLKESIICSTPNDNPYRDFFLCAFSNILKSSSKWLTKSIKPQIDPLKSPAVIRKAFSEQFKMMYSANSEVMFNNNVKSQIETGSILCDFPNPPAVDLIVTSPPYVTSYEYADLHQLSTLWLGFADDHRKLRNGTIGSLYHDYNFNKEWKNLNKTGIKTVALLLDQHKTKARSVAKYFLDMQLVTTKAYKMLAKNGMALFVIGNTSYKNVIIENARHLSEALYDAGFVDVQVTKRKISGKTLTPYRDEKGKFSSNANGRKVYSEEYIIVGRKY